MIRAGVSLSTRFCGVEYKNNHTIMHEQSKKYMWWAVSLSVLMFGFASLRFSGAVRDFVELSSPRTFSVSGEGKVVAVPDIATFTAGVITEGGKNIADLQKNNTTKVNKIIAFIKSKGVDAKDIKTEQYSLDPRYQYAPCYRGPEASGVCPPPEIVGGQPAGKPGGAARGKHM